MSKRLPKRSPIGIDLGARSIKAVQLAGAGNRWRLHALADVPRKTLEQPITTAEMESFMTVLDRAGFVGRRAVLAAPSNGQLAGMLELPPRAPGMPFDQIARMEFARVHRCEPAGFELAYWDLPQAGRAGKGTNMMAVGYAHSAADQFLDTIEAGGVDAVALDSMTCALARSCSALHAPGVTTGIMDIGHGAATLALAQSGTLVYERRMTESGTKNAAASLKKQLDLDPDEIEYLVHDGGFGEPGDRRGTEAFADARRVLASHFAPLAHELRLTFSYTEHQYPQAPVKLLLLVGGGAGIPGIAEHLKAALDIDVRAVRPTDVVECTPTLLERTTPAMMAALGLAQFVED